MTQLRHVRTRVVPLGKSDHKGVLVTYAFGAFQFKALTANGQATDKPTDLLATIHAAAGLGADVINWQEIYHPVQRAAIEALPGYDTFWPSGANGAGPANNIPVSVRTKTGHIVSGKWHKIHGGLAKVSPTRGITEVVVEFPTFTLTDLNVHLVNGVDGAGKAPRAWRRRRHELGMKLFASLLEAAAKSGPAVGSGDMNTTRRELLTRWLPNAAFDTSPKVGTHDTRPIDWWVRPDTHAETTPEEKPVANGIYPAAIRKLIAPGANDPAIKPRVAILHVDAGNAFSLFDFFKNRSGGIESHFHVRADGVVEQYRNIYRQADANHLANDFAVSIETQGLGGGTWNDKQLAALKALLTWLNKEAGIPLVKCPRWDGAGVGYHVQFGAPGKWTPVSKSCPGPNRIRQFDDVLVPWMKAPAKPAAPNFDAAGDALAKASKELREAEAANGKSAAAYEARRIRRIVWAARRALAKFKS